MNWLLELKRPFIWLSRFRHRCGYGVHSPFAFSLITDVIYEKRAYYAYARLERDLQELSAKGVWNGSRKVNRFLFRLVNRVQPTSLLEVGCSSVASHYMQQAKPSALYVEARDLAQLEQVLSASIKGSLDFVYFNDWKHSEQMLEAFERCVPRVALHSVFVVHGICYSQQMKALWKQLQADERVGITFDLYDVGLLFFDKTKIKQHYIVNF